jgi:hypothetical protein
MRTSSHFQEAVSGRDRRPASGSGPQSRFLCCALLLSVAWSACGKSSSSLTSPGVGLTGSYALTLIASPSCATVTDWITHQAMPFPDSVRVRHYDAEFTGRSGILTPTDGPGRQQIAIGGLDDGGSSDFSVIDGVLTIIVPPNAEDLARRDDGLLQGGPTCTGGDYWWESISSAEIFETCGTWRASMDDPKRIAGTIDGAFGYYKKGDVGRGPNLTTDLFCRATDHQFTLTKR